MNNKHNENIKLIRLDDIYKKIDVPQGFKLRIYKTNYECLGEKYPYIFEVYFKDKIKDRVILSGRARNSREIQLEIYFYSKELLVTC